VRQCARAGPRRGTGKEELTGRSHDAARESGRTGEMIRRLAKQAHEAERERNGQVRATDADNPDPLGRERERESARGEGNRR
jgi:hypothetical protein